MRGIILVVLMGLCESMLAQTKPADLSSLMEQVAPQSKPAPAKTENLSNVEGEALRAVLRDREALGKRIMAIDTDVRLAHPGYHLEWGADNVQLVKDAPPAAKVEPKK